MIDENTTDDNNGTRYKLVGIIVHMGQANGGHYYSFIQNKSVLLNELCCLKSFFGNI